MRAEPRLMRTLAAFLVSVACLAQSTQREQVAAQMHSRPADPWPRSLGHIVYAIPGSDEFHKGYEEPGGSFSPYTNTFGVSIWVKDARGVIRATSDSLPLSELRQSFRWTQNPLPDLSIETVAYAVLWRIVDATHWTLDLTPKVASGESLELVIRSVGPAGGPITSLQWDAGTLAINKDWSLGFPPGVTLTALGHEGDADWTTHENTVKHWAGADGWGYARLAVRAHALITLTTSQPGTSAKLKWSTLQSTLSTDLPDPRFAASLNAQVANEMMALVSNQTRPGDPLNYPLAWLRDGAYILVSLARAGQLDVARSLATYFTDHDYFGGFGSEADAPGLSIWALEEVADCLHDPNFDSTIFPAIKRKELQIERMLTATSPIRQPVFGPIVPAYRNHPDLDLVASPASNGLIQGRMDWHQPILFINAVSYRGLLDGAELAARLGDSSSAAQWTSTAASLRKSWAAAYRTPARDDDRTFISALWPSWIDPDPREFKQGLEARWSKTHKPDSGYRHRPLWTYFDIAEAHQWLLEGNTERAWDVLDWFWRHQSAPGFYTWWEGSGEENTFGKWHDIRGWVHPTGVTPHYWTAAEVLLLQLDMLAYLEPGPQSPSLVIGQGVRPYWLKSPLSVRGVSTRIGMVDWTWKDTYVTVVIHQRAHSAEKASVRLGPSFPPRTKVKLTLD